jgi:hypothetical protein
MNGKVCFGRSLSGKEKPLPKAFSEGLTSYKTQFPIYLLVLFI